MNDFIPIEQLIEEPISGEWGSEGDTIKVIRTTNFCNDGRIDFSNVVSREIEGEKIERKILKVGDIIIEKSGGSPTQPVGRVVYFENSNEDFLCNNFTSVLRPKKKIIFPKYLFYLLWANHQFGFTGAFQNKTTGIINLKLKDYIKKTKIPIPPLETQKKIAAILDVADDYRQKTKLLIEKYDELAQSLFLEMFGDISNCIKFPIVILGDLLIEVKDGPHVSPKYSEKGIPILSTRNIRPFELILNETKFVSQETYKEITKRFKPQKGDILLTKGGTTGYAKVVDWGWDFCIWVHLAALRPNTTLVKSEFLEAALNSYYCYRQSQEYTRGIANRDLGLTRLTNIKIPLPPIVTQLEFIKRLQLIKTQKVFAKTALAKSEELFNSLLQKAFSGELLNN